MKLFSTQEIEAASSTEQDIEASVTYARFLVADVRHGLVCKAGFNPDQPRDDHGRWTPTGDGDGGYSPDKPG